MVICSFTVWEAALIVVGYPVAVTIVAEVIAKIIFKALDKMDQDRNEQN